MNHLIFILKERALQLYSTLNIAFRKPRYSSKVFCIGYNKTGTTSVGKALQFLGYSHSSFNTKVWRTYYGKGEIEKVLNYIAKFDSFDDLPWLKEDMIPVLDQAFPKSKFIYLIRDEVSWQKSFKNWTFKMTGAYPDVEEGLSKYRKHKEYVLKYFENRSAQDFLILDVQDELGFKKLAEFLGKTVTIDKLPHFNKTNAKPELV